MSFLTTMLKSDLENIGKSAEPYISDTIIEIMNNEENSKKMINSIIKKFLEIIEKKLQNDTETKIKLLSIVKDVMNKDVNVYKNVYKENIGLKERINDLEERIRDLEEQNMPLVQAEVVKQNGGDGSGLGALVKDVKADVAKTKGEISEGINQFTPLKNSNSTPFDSSTKLPVTTSNDAPQERPILNLRGYKADATEGMEAFNNITNGLQNIKDIKDIPLLGAILNIIIQLSEQKIRDDICSKLNRNKDKIIESAIRVFVKQITEDEYINNIETKEIYDSINKKIKSMESEKIDKKVGGKKFTHKKKSNKSKQSKKSKKTNRKSRANKL